MKSKIKRRIMALMLCLTMILNGSVSVLADDTTMTEDQQVVIEEQVENEAIEEVVEQTDVVEEVVETTVEENETALTWSEDGVTVTVSEKVAGAIPEGATLSVTPIIEGDEYTDVETQLQEKAANEEYEIAGFLAYDICLVDTAGNEIEPNDNVNVSIEYDEAVIPEMEVAEDAALDVTVMHFAEDGNGEVAEIVDMVAEEEIEAAVTTTETVKVEKVEFVTDSFSTYTITWTSANGSTFPWTSTLIVYIKYVDEDGIEISGKSGQINGVDNSISEVDLTSDEYKLDIPGYDFDESRIDSLTGTVIEKLKFENGTGYTDADKVQYVSTTTSSDWKDWLSTSIYSGNSDSGTVYMIYKAKKTTLQANVLDANGNPISGYTSSTIELKAYNEVVLKDKASTIDGYGYQKAVVATDASSLSSGIEITSLTYDESVVSYKTTTGSTGTLETNQKVYLIYYKYSDEISISNLIATADDSGRLKPVLSGSLNTAASVNGAEVTYKWYKDTGNGYVESKLKKFDNGEYNLATDGSWVNVVLDSGAKGIEQPDVTYIVEVYINGELRGTSSPFEIPYWDELQNGSFETPAFSSHMVQFLNEDYDNFIWKSTGLGYESNKYSNIEVLNASTQSNRENLNGSYAWETPDLTDYTKYARDGYQFAELNASAVGALYQDVLTVKGEKLNFWFSHRARGNYTNITEKDSMYVLAMPASTALTYGQDGGPIDNQTEVEAVIDHISNYPGAYIFTGDPDDVDNDGDIYEVISDDQKWYDYTGEYTSTSYLTRFFFVAGETAVSGGTVGNFLDRVGFSQDLPPAAPGEFNLQLVKVVTGLSEARFAALKNSLTFTISVKDANGNPVTQVNNTSGVDVSSQSIIDGTQIAANAEGWVWEENADGTYTGIYTLNNKVIPLNTSYTYSITENGTAVSGYGLTTDVDITGGVAKDDKVSVDIKEQDSVVYEITNDYVADAKKDVKFTKIWDDFNNFYNTRPSTLKVVLTGKVGETVVHTAEVTLNASDFTTNKWTHTFTNVPVYYGVDASGNPQKIEWSVAEVLNSAYDYTVTTGTGNGSSEALVNKSTLKHLEVAYSTVAESSMPTYARTFMLMSRAMTTSLEDEETTSTTETPMLYAGRPGSSGSSSSSTTFSHFDIQADGQYTFVSGGKTYTVKFDFYAEKWYLYEGSSASGSYINSGDVDVSSFTIVNKETGENIAVQGSWQNATSGSGSSKEFRISGTFNRSDVFTVSFEIPLEINGVVVNLKSVFDTSYDAEEPYNTCPGGGNSKGIDFVLGEAMEATLGNGVLAITKEFVNLTGATPDTTFVVKDSSGKIIKTVEFNADFSKSSTYEGSYTINDVTPGTYTVEETTSVPTGFSSVETKWNVDGGDVTTGSTATAITVKTGITTVNFVNTYTQVPAKQILTFQKLWNEPAGTTHPSEITLNVTLSDGTTKNITLTESGNWVQTLEVESGITIKSVSEVSVSGYTSAIAISDNSTKATVTNTKTGSESSYLTVTKEWINDTGYESMRQPISVQLYRQNLTTKAVETVGDPVTLNTSNNWTHTFSGLVVKVTDGSNETEYEYFVEELNKVEGYKCSGPRLVNGIVVISNELDTNELDEEVYIKNTLQTEQVTVNKYWNDENNKYGGRPDTLDITLRQKSVDAAATDIGTVVRTFTFGSGDDTDKNKWSAILTLPKLANEVNYFATEDEDLLAELNYGQSYYSADNNLIEFVNSPTKKDIVVEKNWVDADNAYGKRPASLEFTLQYSNDGGTTWNTYTEDNGTGIYTMTGTTDYWYLEITGLPTQYDYRVVENVPSGYQVSYNEYQTAMTNTLQWQMVKISSTTEKVHLAGAEFAIQAWDYGKDKYVDIATATSDENGIIQWLELDENILIEDDVEYRLVEKKAPAGYMLDETEWTIVFKNGVPVVYTSTMNGDVEVKTYADNAMVDSKLNIYFENTPLYELPSSGSHGIYMYMIGGVMLMAFATFVLYKNRRKEVLVR